MSFSFGKEVAIPNEKKYNEKRVFTIIGRKAI